MLTPPGAAPCRARRTLESAAPHGIRGAARHPGHLRGGRDNRTDDQHRAEDTDQPGDVPAYSSHPIADLCRHLTEPSAS